VISGGDRMRDTIKDEVYFRNFIEEEDIIETILDTMKDREKVVGDSDKGIQNGLLMLAVNYKNYLIALYSAGERIDNIKSKYEMAIQVAEQIWDDDNSYVDLLWFIFLGVLLDIKEETVEKLKSMIIKHKIKDKLINYLMNSLDKTWTLSGTYFMKEPYLFWEDALENSNKDEIIPKIKDYLVNKWYDAHKDMSWYNSHKKGDYFGYWSFESAAIVNALGLNDTCLKGVKYYPYDLVHYEN
jgi:hypothetical protein